MQKEVFFVVAPNPEHGIGWVADVDHFQKQAVWSSEDLKHHMDNLELKP